MSIITNGKIHTAELELRSEDGIDIPHIFDENDHRITKQRMMKGAHVIRFNPEGRRLHLPESGGQSHVTCNSYAQFEFERCKLATDEELPEEHMRVMRADFKMDCYNPEIADRFRKMGDLLIAAFNIRYNVPEKHQYYGGTQTTCKHKDNKTRHGCFEFECYNKGVQRKSDPAIWRLELRYIIDRRKKEHEDITAKEMLFRIMETLFDLISVYDDIPAGMNPALLRNLVEIQTESKQRVRLNQFALSNKDRIFTRAQLLDLYQAVGVKNAKKSLENYCARGGKGHLLISKREYTEFIQDIIRTINNYIERERI